MPHSIFWDKATWSRKFVWFPKKCIETGQRIYMEYGYKGTAIYTGPGDPAIVIEWLSTSGYLIAKLKNKI